MIIWLQLDKINRKIYFDPKRDARVERERSIIPKAAFSWSKLKTALSSGGRRKNLELNDPSTIFSAPART